MITQWIRAAAPFGSEFRSLCARKSPPEPHPNVLVVGTAKHGVCFRDGGQLIP
jgi:hypothetical protein